MTAESVAIKLEAENAQLIEAIKQARQIVSTLKHNTDRPTDCRPCQLRRALVLPNPYRETR